MARRGKPATASEADRRGIQSVEVSAVILSALAQAGAASSLKQLSDATGMPPSKTHRYLSSFIRTGLVRQEPETGLYDLGLAALDLGLAALSRLSVTDMAQGVMKELTDQTGITSLLSVWGQQGPTVVRWQRARTQLVTSLGLGSVLPLTSSATGHAFLSYLPQSLTGDLLAKELATNKLREKTAARPHTKAEVKSVISTVKETGVACVDSSVIPGLRAAAAPILDPQGDAAAVVTLIGTEIFLTDTKHEALQTLRSACERISLNQNATH